MLCLLHSLAACTFLLGLQEDQPYVSEQCDLITRQLDLGAYLGVKEVGFFNDVKVNEKPSLESLNAAAELTEENSSHENNSKSSSSGNNSFGQKSGDTLLAIIVAWADVTFVVSGSIVVIGNILHWSEYQGRCDESELRQLVYQF